MPDAVFMARDAIAMTGFYRQDQGKGLPPASSPESVKADGGETVTLIDVDFGLYRQKYDNQTIRKNLTIPRWLNREAEKAGINFSAVLQEALKQRLEI